MEKTMESVAKLVKVNLYVFNKETSTGHKFPDYSTKTKEGKWVKVKFTKEVVDLPKKGCTLFVPADKIHISTNKKTGYPEFWISKVDHTEEVEHEAQDLSNYFDEV